MISSLENCTITVNRRTKSTVNSLGEPTYTTAATYTNIPARLIFKKPAIQFKETGERGVYDNLMYVRADYVLKLEDSVTNSLDAITRKVVGVETAFGPLNVIHHYEIKLLEP